MKRTMRTQIPLLPIILAASLGVVSLWAACFDDTITTLYDPWPVPACQGSNPNDPCLFRTFMPALKSCTSGPNRTDRTCRHTETRDITWYEYPGKCRMNEGVLVCIAERQYGPYTMYNFDQWEALPDADCDRTPDP